MKRLALLCVPFVLASPALAADLDGPRYSEREIYIERPARVVERYYVPAPVYEYYDEEPAYVYSYRPYPRAYYAYNRWRAYDYYPRWRHRHHWHRW
jgi:hypothetical protein